MKGIQVRCIYTDEDDPASILLTIGERYTKVNGDWILGIYYFYVRAKNGATIEAPAKWFDRNVSNNYLIY